MPDVAYYLKIFERALSGPINSLFPVRLSAIRALCKGMIRFFLHINGLVIELKRILLYAKRFVKHFAKI